MKTKNTKLALFIGSGLLLSAVMFTSCSKSNSGGGGGGTTVDTVLQKYGYDSASQVGKDSLVAYFPFEGNVTETVAGLSFTNSGLTFGTGVKGQALQGSDGHFASYTQSTTLTTLQALGSFTVAFWINSGVVDTTISSTYTPGHGAQGIFFLADTAVQFGNLEIDLEPYSANADTLTIKCGFVSNGSSVVWQGWGPTLVLPGAVGKWTHVVFTYNAGSSILTGYVNGSQGGTNSLSGPYGPFNGTETVYANDPGVADANNAPLMGGLVFQNTYGMEFGTWAWDVNPQSALLDAKVPQRGNNWEDDFAGQLDEFRIYNAALSTSQVNALYNLEKLGR